MDIWQVTQSLGFPIVIAVLFFIENKRRAMNNEKRLDKQHDEHREDRNRWKQEDQQIQLKMIGKIDSLMSNHEQWEDKRDLARQNNIDSFKVLVENELKEMKEKIIHISSNVTEIQSIVIKLDNNCKLTQKPKDGTD